MAQEITVSAALGMAKSGLAATIAVVQKQLDLSATPYVRRTFVATTAAIALPIGDIATPGWFLIINTDPTNYVEVMSATGGAVLLRIKPGEFAMGRFGVAAPALKANTANVTVDYLLLDS